MRWGQVYVDGGDGTGVSEVATEGNPLFRTEISIFQTPKLAPVRSDFKE